VRSASGARALGRRVSAFRGVFYVLSSQVKSSQVKSSLDLGKSSQVKSSQVIQNGGRLSAAFGAHRWRERSGGQISAQPAPLDSPESGHHPHLLDLDHRGALGLQHRAFSGSLLYGNATRLQGRRRERSGACARAGVVLRACLVCRGVHAIPVSMPSLCPCHSVCHVAIRSCVRASRLCACHEHTRMERVHARMERVHARVESCRRWRVRSDDWRLTRRA